MKNKLCLLMMTSAFLIGFSTSGIAEPQRSPSDLHLGSGQVANTAAQMQEQSLQAKSTHEQATAQIEATKEQSLQQGVSQTQGLAEELNQTMNNTAKDMQTVVNSSDI